MRISLTRPTGATHEVDRAADLPSSLQHRAGPRPREAPGPPTGTLVLAVVTVALTYALAHWVMLGHRSMDLAAWAIAARDLAVSTLRFEVARDVVPDTTGLGVARAGLDLLVWAGVLVTAALALAAVRRLALVRTVVCVAAAGLVAAAAVIVFWEVGLEVSDRDLARAALGYVASPVLCGLAAAILWTTVTPTRSARAVHRLVTTRR